MRTAVLLVMLAAILAVVWILFLESDDGAAPPTDGTGYEAPPASELEGEPQDSPDGALGLKGRSDAECLEAPGVRRPVPVGRATSRGVVRIRLRGTVRTEAGLPVVGATVYQLSKKWSAGTSWTLSHTTTDPDGRFVLECLPPRSTWICARAPGRRTVFLDGATVDEDDAMVLALAESPKLVVRLVGADGEPVGLGGVRAVPTTRGGVALAFPGPEAVFPEQFEMTDENGIAVFDFEVPVPVMVIPEVEGMVAEPAEQWLAEAAGAVTFQVTLGTTLVIEARDVDDSPLEQSLWVSIRDPTTGREVAVFRSDEGLGRAEADLALLPASYHVEVTACGYEPHLRPDLRLPGAGATVRCEVRMEVLRQCATLRIVIPGGEPASRSDPQPPSSGRRPALLLRRREVGWSDFGWQVRDDFRWDAKAGAVVVDLRPGTYDMVLALPTTGDVAELGTLVLPEGSSMTRRVNPRKGVVFRLYDVLPPDLRVRTVCVEVPGRGFFPPIGSWSNTTVRDAAGLVATIDPAGSLARATPHGGARLGPYSALHVILHVTDWSGQTHRFVVGR